MNFKMTYLLYGLPLIVIAAWIGIFYAPLAANIYSNEKLCIGIKEESNRIDGEIRNVAEMHRRGERAYLSFHQFQRQFPVMDRLPEFMRDFMKSAAGQGVTVVSIYNVIPTLEEGEKTPLVSSIFEIDIKGPFLDIGRFIEQMQNMPAFKEMLMARIWFNEKEYPNLSGKLVVQFKAFKEMVKVEAK